MDLIEINRRRAVEKLFLIALAITFVLVTAATWIQQREGHHFVETFSSEGRCYAACIAAAPEGFGADIKFEAGVCRCTMLPKDER